MRVPRVRFTVERLMVTLAFVIAGSLVVGSVEGIAAEVAEADAVVFGLAYAAEVGLALVLAARCLRRSTRPRLPPAFASMFVLAVMAWATIEWPIVREWAFHARCEIMYRHELEAGEQDPIKPQDQVTLHAGLRRKYQRAMVRPWTSIRD